QEIAVLHAVPPVDIGEFGVRDLRADQPFGGRMSGRRPEGQGMSRSGEERVFTRMARRARLRAGVGIRGVASTLGHVAMNLEISRQAPAPVESVVTDQIAGD